MAAEKKCCVPSCGLDTEILHKFPHPENDADRFWAWISKVGGNILTLDNMYVYKYRRICHRHFEAKYQTRSKYLSINAIPMLHLSGISRLPLEDVTNLSISDMNKMEPTPSTSENSRKRPLEMTNASANTSYLSRNEDFPTPVPSTSGQQFEKENIQIDAATTVLRQHSRKMRNIAQKAPEQRDLLKQIKKLQQKNDSYRQRLKKANILSMNEGFQKALKKFKTLAAIFTVMQFREITKPKMGRRFTREEKTMALTLYKRGPRAYRWLSKVFVLPSPVTLSRMMSKACLTPGINENIFRQLKRKVQTMKSHEKLCTLIFDEMALTPHFDYNSKKDRVTGFVNHMGQPYRKIADHAIVYMIRGIVKNYKQPIYYSFCASSTPKEIIVAQIKQIITELQSIGFTVLATVCDQGTTNTAAINALIEENQVKYLRKGQVLRHKVFEINGQTVIPLYDVPHLLKGLRNNFLTKDLQYEMNGVKKTAKWKHVTMLYENNPMYKGLKMIKNLTENHCNKAKIPKMKVKFAAQLFSQTVGKTMGYLAEIGILPKEATDTADFILFVDDLFDSLNGSYDNSKKRAKDLLQNVTPNSRHAQVWSEARKIIKSFKFVSQTGRVGTVPSVRNWIRTIDNMKLLKDDLFSKYNFKSLWCRHLNQDPLENFFGSIRSHGVRNNSPTCAAFEVAFAALLVNNMSSNYAPGSNCEDDMCRVFESFSELFFRKKESNVVNELDYNDLNDNLIIDINEKKQDPRIRAQLEYVTGYLTRKAKKIYKKCTSCKNELLQKVGESNDYINHREFLKNKKLLTYPSNSIKSFFSACQDIICHILSTKSDMFNLRTYIKTVLYVSVDTSFYSCNEHRKECLEFMFHFLTNFFAYNWCKSTNKIINGTSNDLSPSDSMHKLAFDYYMKRKKKNKRFI